MQIRRFYLKSRLGERPAITEYQTFHREKVILLHISCHIDRAVNRKWRKTPFTLKLNGTGFLSCCPRVIIMFGGKPLHIFNFQSTKCYPLAPKEDCAVLNCATFVLCSNNKSILSLHLFAWMMKVSLMSSSLAVSSYCCALWFSMS